MFEVCKSSYPKNSVAVIRTATGNELSNYEKNKLANIEEEAQKNKIEVICVNNQRLQIDAANKEVNIELGDLAFKDRLAPKDFSTDELFFIKCELD